MTTDPEIEKPLPEQILERMLSSLESHTEFDAKSLAVIRGLVGSGRITRVQEVLKAIQVEEGGGD